MIMVKHKSSHVSTKIGTGLAPALLAPLCSGEYRRLGGAGELLCNGTVNFLVEGTAFVQVHHVHNAYMVLYAFVNPRLCPQYVP